MLSRLATAILSIMVAVLLIAGWGPPIGFNVSAPVRWVTHLPPRIGLPLSVTAQRDAAIAAGRTAVADAAICHTNEYTLNGALTRQNSAVATLSRDSAIRLAKSETAVHEALRGAEKASAAGALVFNAGPLPTASLVITAPEAGMCKRAEAVDAAFVEGLK